MHQVLHLEGFLKNSFHPSISKAQVSKPVDPASILPPFSLTPKNKVKQSLIISHIINGTASLPMPRLCYKAYYYRVPMNIVQMKYKAIVTRQAQVGGLRLQEQFQMPSAKGVSQRPDDSYKSQLLNQKTLCLKLMYSGIYNKQKPRHIPGAVRIKLLIFTLLLPCQSSAPALTYQLSLLL